MKIFKEMSIKEFEAWEGATDTQEKIISAGKAEEFDALINEVYPDGISKTHLNDILWFNQDGLFEILEITEEE